MITVVPCFPLLSALVEKKEKRNFLCASSPLRPPRTGGGDAAQMPSGNSKRAADAVSVAVPLYTLSGGPAWQQRNRDT